ncbi:MAG: molybdopterin cofactor-binding domain-containing protein [Acidobacteriota bacterium]
MTRRQFLSTLGGASLIFAIDISPGAETDKKSFGSLSEETEPECIADYTDTDYSNWIIFDPDNKVRVFTGRTELGQGLKTVITATITQGLDIEPEQLTIIQGDTDQCPNDGPTNGSAACRVVGWGFWLACLKIQSYLLSSTSKKLGIASKDLKYKSGKIKIKGDTETFLNYSEISSGEAVVIKVNPDSTLSDKQYVDKKVLNVNGIDIVTGALKFVNDLKIPGMLYAGFKTQPYHQRVTRLNTFDDSKAKEIDGIKAINGIDGRVVVIGERYSDVLKGLALTEGEWTTPGRPKELNIEEELRNNSYLEVVKEDEGDVDGGLKSSATVLSETYYTQYIVHAAIETDRSLASYDNNLKKWNVWASTQWPHIQREQIAKRLKIDESDVRVISQPAGGAFGGKIQNTVNAEAASISNYAKAPIKLIYSRKDQFQLRSSFKAAVVIDITSGVDSNGKIIARKIDEYDDYAEGSTFVYDIPNVNTNSYMGKIPFGRTVVRGTSYVQTCFAIESHVDMLAKKIGADRFEFRRNNVLYPAFYDLIDSCAERSGYGSTLGADEGIGIALVKHGGAQLGAIASRVRVDRETGKVDVLSINASFDVGIVVNEPTAVVGIRGGITMGIGYVLKESIDMDGWGSYTEFFSDYGIPRFSDVPPVIDIKFFDNLQPGGTVRGLGEMPVVPTIGSIANAIHDAIGIRFYSTPITPEKIIKALETNSGN